MRNNSLLTIPHYIRAKDEDDMQRKMLALQLRLQHKLTFYDIRPYKGGLIAWYEWTINPKKLAVRDGK
jgi:hypothetical protein